MPDRVVLLTVAIDDVLRDKGGAVYNVRAASYDVQGNGEEDGPHLRDLIERTIPAAGGILFFPPGRYRIGIRLTFPRRISLQFAPGARLVVPPGVTLTVSSHIDAGPHQIFDAQGAVDLGESGNSEVLAEWWGAEAASGTEVPKNSTAALQAALNTRRNVTLSRGVYGVTSVMLKANGQRLAGQGTFVDNSDPVGGTKILRLSGTEPAVTIGNYMGQRVTDVTIDGGTSSRGDLLRDTGKNTIVGNVRLQRAMSGYALHVVGTNLCHYSDIYFPDTLHRRVEPSFGHIRCEKALYSTFTRCSSGMVSGGANVRISGSTGLKFDSFYCDPHGTASGIHISGTCADIEFDALNMESANVAAPLVVVDATRADIRGIRFRGVRVLQTSPTREPVFRLAGAGTLSLFVLDGLLLEDTVSPTRALIVLDGVRNSRFDNAEINHAKPFTFIRCSGTRSDGIRSSNTAVRGPGAGTNEWKCSGLFVDTSGFKQTFLEGNDFATLVNVSAPVDAARIGPGGGVVLGGGGVTDANGDLTLMASNGLLSLKTFRQATEPNLGERGIALWQRTPDNALFLVTRHGRGVRKIPLD